MHTGRICAFFALATIVVFCAPTQANTTNTSQVDVKTTIAEINQILLPYKVKFIAEGLEPGRVVPIDLPSDPTNWHADKKSQPETLAGKIRILLRVGVCDSSTLALQKIFELDWLLYSLNFSES